MTRHSKSKLPEGAEGRPEDKKLRCLICSKWNPLDSQSNWILPDSFNAHRKSNVHTKALSNHQKHVEAQQEIVDRHIPSPPREAAILTKPAAIEASVSEPFKANNGKPSEKEQTFWGCWNPTPGEFTMDNTPQAAMEAKQRELERRLDEFGIWDTPDEDLADADVVGALEQHWDDLEDDEMMAEVLKSIDRDSPSDPQDNDGDWHPYPSKLVFLLDVIDNLPRLKISRAFLKAMLWVLDELGVKRVPSYDTFRSTQKKIRENVGIPTTQYCSPKGNTFSFNDPCSLIAKDWANPETCDKIQRYPVVRADGVVSEIWHADKWRHKMDRHLLSPMYDDQKGRHYFIDEPALLNNGKMVVPVKWLEDEEGNELCEVWEIRINNATGIATILDGSVKMIRANELFRNMLDLRDEGFMPTWCEDTIAKGHHARMPNPDRILAEGDPIYVNLIDIFGDDVSGNKSKSWNKHWNMYMTHRNLPRQLLNQQFHIHFVSTSTVASIPEQFLAVKEAILKTHSEPIKVQHGRTGQQIRFKVYCTCGPGDNPSQSETAGHIGGAGNYPCRKCHVGGNQKEKESDEGYHKMFKVGMHRSSDNTLSEVKAQVRAACLGVAATVEKLQSSTGVKDAYTQHWIDDLINRAREMKKAQPLLKPVEIQSHLMKWVDNNESKIYNPFLSLPGFDAAQDTPVEILHTILLGVVKYVWRSSYISWNSAHKKMYTMRLQATNTSGLGGHAIRASYITQYANSLIGRQLKTLVQVNTFHVYDLVDDSMFLLTKAVGELSALLWYPEIRNSERYLVDIMIASENVLDIAALVDPLKIVVKIKYHLLTHLKDDIKHFGPLVGVASEVFESFNGIFRYCSIFSNHLAPSRDIAIQLSGQESIKHILSGGWWQDKSCNGKWVNPGPKIQALVVENQTLRMLIGWPDSKTLMRGSIKLMPVERTEKRTQIPRKSITWRNTSAASAINCEDYYATLLWYRAKTVTSASGDQCVVGSWVFAEPPFQDVNHVAGTSQTSQAPMTGRIIEIIQDTKAQYSLVVLDVFQVGAERHDVFGMPILLRRLEERTVVIIQAKGVLFEYNVQHDCRKAKCCATGQKKRVHERVESETVTESFIEHQPLDEYIINTHAFHNAHLLRESLPHDLTKPLPFCADRQEHHNSLASQLRATQHGKHETAAQKRAEKVKAVSEEQTRKRRRVQEEDCDAGENDPSLEPVCSTDDRDLGMDVDSDGVDSI